jgi:spermidine synthase
LATATTPEGKVLLLQEHDGEHYLKVDGVQLMSTRAASSEAMMADLACVRPCGRVLIGGLGFGFTLRRVLELVSDDAKVEVAELLAVIVEWNREHLGRVNGGLLDDPRAEVHVDDVFHRIDGGTRYDAILMDVDNSPDPLVQRGNARVYSRRGLQRVKAALSPRGRVVFWSANRDKAFARELEKVFGNVESIPAKAYPKAKRFTHTLFVADRV